MDPRIHEDDKGGKPEVQSSKLEELNQNKILDNKMDPRVINPP